MTAAPQSTPVDSAPVGSAEARPMRVEHRGGDKFDINVRGHVVRVDQPVKDRGEDTAPTPTELFIASLASCVAFYARRYLARHDLPTDGLAVEATFDMGAKPARVAGIDLRLIVPEGVPPERLDALLAVATHCTVHNTLTSEPDVSITVAEASAGQGSHGDPVGSSKRPSVVTAASLSHMDPSTDTNAAIWRSQEHVQSRASRADEFERKNAAQWRLLGDLLPFGEQDSFTFLDLGSGTGSAARAILGQYPHSTAILADFSSQMMAAGEAEMKPFAGRFHYVEFDMSTSSWPAAIPSMLDAVVSSMCIHHMPDHRKKGLFAEIFERLAPGGWYLNYEAVSTADPAVEEAWKRANDRHDPEQARKNLHRTPQEQARHENHVRYLIPLPQQLDYLRSAGFLGIDVYWKHLDDVIYGGHRSA